MNKIRDDFLRQGLPVPDIDQMEAQWSNLTCGRGDAFIKSLIAETGTR